VLEQHDLLRRVPAIDARDLRAVPPYTHTHPTGATMEPAIKHLVRQVDARDYFCARGNVEGRKERGGNARSGGHQRRRGG
jgi:hypothetical protein